jgi:hypothetical protein
VNFLSISKRLGTTASAVLVGLALASCTISDTKIPVDVPPVPKAVSAGEPVIPGRYAVILQGSWMMTTKPDNTHCGHSLYAINPTPVFEDAIKASLTSYIQAVDFIKPRPENPKINFAGYDAVILLGQSFTHASWAYKDGHSTTTHRLTLHVALYKQGKEFFQQDVIGTGSDGGAYSFCSEAASFHGNATQRAIIDVIGQTARIIHQQLGAPT